jgi:hypothetical protein
MRRRVRPFDKEARVRDALEEFSEYRGPTGTRQE